MRTIQSWPARTSASLPWRWRFGKFAGCPWRPGRLEARAAAIVCAASVRSLRPVSRHVAEGPARPPETSANRSGRRRRLANDALHFGNGALRIGTKCSTSIDSARSNWPSANGRSAAHRLSDVDPGSPCCARARLRRTVPRSPWLRTARRYSRDPAAANVKLPVPQPISITRSPAARPAEIEEQVASFRLQRPMSASVHVAPCAR